MHPYLTEQLASQRLRDLHQAASRDRLSRQALTARGRQRRTIPTFTFRRRRPCAA